MTFPAEGTFKDSTGKMRACVALALNRVGLKVRYSKRGTAFVCYISPEEFIPRITNG